MTTLHLGILNCFFFPVIYSIPNAKKQHLQDLPDTWFVLFWYTAGQIVWCATWISMDAGTSEMWMIVPLVGLTNTGRLSLTSMTVIMRSAVPQRGGRPWSVATTVRLKRSDDWSRRRDRTSPVFGSREKASKREHKCPWVQPFCLLYMLEQNQLCAIVFHQHTPACGPSRLKSTAPFSPSSRSTALTVIMDVPLGSFSNTLVLNTRSVKRGR